jgi:hypothetical protein
MGVNEGLYGEPARRESVGNRKTDCMTLDLQEPLRDNAGSKSADMLQARSPDDPGAD